VSTAPDYPPGWPPPDEPAPLGWAAPSGEPASAPQPSWPGQPAPGEPDSSGQTATPAQSGWPRQPAADLGGLLAAAGTAVADLAGRGDLGQMADRDAVAVMGALTTLVGRLDGLRVKVAREVRERDICGLRGRRTLAGWLDADARLADDARKLARLAGMGPGLPKITALLDSGAISLTQAATACWQISQLPHLPVPPDTLEPPDPPGPAGPPGAPAEPGGPGDGAAGQHADPGPGPGDSATQPGPCADGDGDRDADARPGSDPDGHGDSDARPGSDPGGDGEAPAGPGDGDGGPGPGLPGAAGAGAGDVWAGLWRAGDVHAAADELFAAFLPGLDGQQLRQLGAHLREAADSQQHAGDETADYARRGLRISRSLGGAGEISGRLHAEAAEQVIAAFEELGGKTGPDDNRTKAQRWADLLTRLAALAGPQPASAPPAGTPPVPATGPATPADPATSPGDPDDDQPCDTDTPSGHHHPAPAAGRDHGQEHAPATSHDSHGQAASADTGPGHDHGDEPCNADSSSGHDHHGQAHDPGPDHDRDGPGGGGPGRPAAAIPAAYQRPRVIVTVPLSTLLGHPLSPGAALGSGAPLTAEAARRLACDAEIIRLITSPAGPPDGGLHSTATARLTQLMAAAIAQLPPPLATPSAVLDIGRKSPGWTPRQRDALYVQYGGHCGFGRCDGPIDVIHHIIHWLYGGKTRIINGFPCCKYHHWLLHEGGWRIKKRSTGEISIYPPPPGWKPGTIYRHGKPLTE
jgi:Domain of unknown function (DUF222)